MQMVMTSDETQIQIFANWPMSHAKRVTEDNRKWCYSASPQPNVSIGTGYGRRGLAEVTSMDAPSVLIFLHLFPKYWSHIKLPSQGPSQPHLCFCLHIRDKLYIFYSDHVGTKKITVKLLKTKGHTIRNTTYSKAIRLRFTME